MISLVNNVDLFLDKADEMTLMGDHLGALRMLRRAAKIDPGSDEVRLMIADSLLDINCCVEAMDYLAPMLHPACKNVKRAVFRLAHCMYGRVQYKAARDLFKLALFEPETEAEIEPLTMDEYANAYESIDICENYLREDAERERALRDADEVELDRCLDKAGKLSEEGRFDEAARFIEDAIVRFPRSVELKTDLMLDYYCQKEFEKGREVYETVPYESKTDISVNCCGAMIFHSLGLKTDEDACVKRICESESNEIGELVRAFTVMTELERFEEAFRFAKQLYDIDPYNRHFIHFYAHAAYDCGRAPLAKRCYERCLIIEPNDSVAAYYKQICDLTIMDGERRRIQIDYSVPPTEFTRRINRTEELVRMTEDERKENIGEILMLTNWAMNDRNCVFGDLYMLLLSQIDEKLSESISRRLLIEPDCSENMRKLAAVRLGSLCSEEKFLIFRDGGISIASFGPRVPEFGEWPECYKKIFKAVHDELETRSPKLAAMGAELCTLYMLNSSIERPRLPYGQAEAMAAAIIYYVYNESNLIDDEDRDKFAFAAAHGITARRLDNALERLKKLIEQAALGKTVDGSDDE